jgi:tyrosine-protein phosphatase SIW14
MKFNSQTVPATVFALLLSSALFLGAAPYQVEQATPAPAGPSTGTHSIGTRVKTKGIPNFGEVTPNLYRGAQPTEEGLQALKDMGINLVVDLRGGASKEEEETAKKLGMQYISIPSHCPFPKDETFAKFLRVVRENPAKKMFVHCQLGVDRTGMAIASYRMAEEGWSANEAMKEMRAFGFSSVHRAMCPGLADYEEGFPDRLKENQAFKELQPYPSAATAK